MEQQVGGGGGTSLDWSASSLSLTNPSGSIGLCLPDHQAKVPLRQSASIEATDLSIDPVVFVLHGKFVLLLQLCEDTLRTIFAQRQFEVLLRESISIDKP